MIVGITYDLREDYLRAGWDPEATAELDSIETVEAVEGALHSLGFATDRIGNILELTRRLARGDRWELVFNFAEGTHGFGREAQIPALLDAHGVPYTFSDPLVLALTLHKGMTKHVVRDVGVPTPDFAVVADGADIDDVDLAYPLFVKPVAAGSSIGISATSRVDNAAELAASCRSLLAQFQQPVLVETYLPGREFTVGMVGTGSDARGIGVMEILLHNAIETGVYSYTNKQHWEGHVGFERTSGALAEEATELALRVWRTLGCRDAGRVDLRADAGGRLNFLEVNPLAGLNPHSSDICINGRLHGIGYHELIQAIMESALKRIASGQNVTA